MVRKSNIDYRNNCEESIEICSDKLKYRGAVSENVSPMDFQDTHISSVAAEYLTYDFQYTPVKRHKKDDIDVHKQVVKCSKRCVLAAFDSPRNGFQAAYNGMHLIMITNKLHMYTKK